MKHWVEALEKYNEQERILGRRNCYSKTNKDAIFMRMKEDQLGSNQLKPDYNVQIYINNRYIVNYTIHQNPSDIQTLPYHIESFKSKYYIYPEAVVADAGYGSEKKYSYLEEKRIEGYVK